MGKPTCRGRNFGFEKETDMNAVELKKFVKALETIEKLMEKK